MDLLRHGARSPPLLRRAVPVHAGDFSSALASYVSDSTPWPTGFRRLAAATPLLPGADQIAFVDIDDTVRQTYGYAKQGAGHGCTGVEGLNPLLAVLSTPTSAPVIAATPLRKGSTN